MYQGEVEGLPVQTPWVDVRSIGAGGGSIAHVDVGGLLQGRARERRRPAGPGVLRAWRQQPTVTDAAFLLGMLGEGQLASGIGLDLERARAALAPLAQRLGFSEEEVARGVMTIAAANMANAIREITIERGQDPRDAEADAVRRRWAALRHAARPRARASERSSSRRMQATSPRGACSAPI